MTKTLHNVHGTSGRLGFEHHDGIDFFWRQDRGRRVGDRLATLQALPFEDTFLLVLHDGDQAGRHYKNPSYDALMAILLLVYDTQ